MKTALFALGPIGLLAVRLSARGHTIGATAPDPRLTVKGNIHAQEVKVIIGAGADFVFEEDYSLPALEDLAGFTKANKRLPGTAPERGGAGQRAAPGRDGHKTAPEDGGAGALRDPTGKETCATGKGQPRAGSREPGGQGAVGAHRKASWGQQNVKMNLTITNTTFL